jgi:hypothetical protein
MAVAAMKQPITNDTERVNDFVDEGILRGIYRDPDSYCGTPRGDYGIEEGGRLVVYGRRSSIQSVSQRTDPLPAREEHEESTVEREDAQRAQDQKVGGRKCSQPG